MLIINKAKIIQGAYHKWLFSIKIVNMLIQLIRIVKNS